MEIPFGATHLLQAAPAIERFKEGVYPAVLESLHLFGPELQVAIAAMPAASAAPEPPLDPPGDQSVPHGLVVVP